MKTFNRKFNVKANIPSCDGKCDNFYFEPLELVALLRVSS